LVNLIVLSYISSDHWVHASPAIAGLLASLFTSIIWHGYMPESVRNCILVPIPKDQKDPTISDNYCPIAFAPTISKALEWAILIEFSFQLAAFSLASQKVCLPPSSALVY